MIIELLIRNFILIEELRLNFAPGLNVLSGETGAGKSILIKAVNIAIGEKANKEYLRPGTEKAEIEVVFHIEDSETLSYLQNHYGMDLSEEPLLIFKREIFESGRTVSRLNGDVANIQTIRDISSRLIDIHGQHEHQSLLKKENYLDLLDRFVSSAHRGKTAELSSLQAEIRAMDNAVMKLKEESQRNAREIDFIRFQMKEIDNADLSENEDEILTEEYNYIKNGESIHENGYAALGMIASNFDEPCNVMDILDKALSCISPIRAYSSKLDEIFEKLEEARYQIDDVSGELGNFIDNFSYDRKRLDYVENRLDEINGLKRKYGNTIEEILSLGVALEKRLADHDHSGKQIEDMETRLGQKMQAYHNLAAEISLERHKASKILSQKILRELKALNLEKALFDISIDTDRTRISSDGYDKIDFLISTNPGQSAKSLSEIASGGEISRIMLAIKVILSKMDTIGTLVFDEIDAGVSGRTAKKVAEKLYETSNDTQVVCITHLPQIAVMGDRHMLIEKSSKDGNTTAHVRVLEIPERISEISRLLDGNDVSDFSANHAKRLMEETISAKTAAKKGKPQEAKHEKT